MSGYVNADPLRLPFSGVTPVSRHTSHAGAEDAKDRAGRQALQLLALYRQFGPLTDRQASDLMQVERTTICARRNELVRLRLVKAFDTVIGDCGVRNVRWDLV